jgi:hypothetical protein
MNRIMSKIHNSGILSYNTCLSLWGSTILIEGKGGSPPPNYMGQLSQIGFVMFDPLAFASP